MRPTSTLPRATLTLTLAALAALAGCADPDPGATRTDSTSPYAHFAGAAVRSLTPEHAETLRTGAGGGYALAAELNGYPGPKHVLELADQLGLDQAQLAAVQAARADVDAKAKAQGQLVLEAYARLDEGFRTGAANATWLAEASDAVGRSEARLRAIHLQAHIELLQVLTPEQVERYNELRGYQGHGDGHDHGH